MDFEIKKDHVRNIQKEMNLIIKYFNKDMDILDFLKLFCDKYKSNFVDYDEKDRRNRVYEHSIRVFENMKMIVKFIDSQGIIIKPELLADVTIATLLHDIGKLYKDTNKHNQYSYVMVDYLLSKNKEITEERKTRIKNAVLYHSNKKHDIENMDFCTKILRDADTLDEEAGNGLYELLMVNITNNSKKDNLNKIDYSTADKILFDKTDYHHKEKVRNKLNLIYSKELYEYLLYDASARYFEIRYKDINNSDIIQNLLNFRGLKSFDDGILKIFIQ
jgi:HD superfamily phosphodiesterase